MKKLGKFLVVGAVAAVACAALVGCGAQTYSGEYKYTNTTYNANYGIGVVVTVDGDTITKVELKDIDGYANVSTNWTADSMPGLKHDATVAALPEYVKKFEGKKVSDIKAITVAVNDFGEPKTGTDAAGQGDYVLTGATQTSGRIILAIQDALKDVK